MAGAPRRMPAPLAKEASLNERDLRAEVHRCPACQSDLPKRIPFREGWRVGDGCPVDTGAPAQRAGDAVLVETTFVFRQLGEALAGLSCAEQHLLDLTVGDAALAAAEAAAVTARTGVHPDEYRGPDDGDLHDALQAAIDRLGDARDLAWAKRWLVELRDQVGCEHFDPACEDGRLTTLCEIVIRG